MTAVMERKPPYEQRIARVEARLRRLDTQQRQTAQLLADSAEELADLRRDIAAAPRAKVFTLPPPPPPPAVLGRRMKEPCRACGGPVIKPPGQRGPDPKWCETCRELPVSQRGRRG